jgi:pyruvate/2-oxoglutarate dehydrogenase complex dihydrolipoamide acyltransferase (E2) component
MLGVPQEVGAPTDGVVGVSLVEPGDAVEFGQGLVVIEFASAVAASPSSSVPGAPVPPTIPSAPPEG